MAADYSQVEVRVLAHLSGDPALLALFNGAQASSSSSSSSPSPLTGAGAARRTALSTLDDDDDDEGDDGGNDDGGEAGGTGREVRAEEVAAAAVATVLSRDVYVSMAAFIFRKTPAEVSPDERTRAKTICLGTPPCIFTMCFTTSD